MKASFQYDMPIDEVLCQLPYLARGPFKRLLKKAEIDELAVGVHIESFGSNTQFDPEELELTPLFPTYTTARQITMQLLERLKPERANFFQSIQFLLQDNFVRTHQAKLRNAIDEAIEVYIASLPAYSAAMDAVAVLRQEWAEQRAEDEAEYQRLK
jgi:hypothetical protein